MALLLQDARIITPDIEVPRGDVLVNDGVVVDVGAGLARPSGAEVLRLSNLTLVPGFIDVHVHGGGGYSLATDDPNEVRSYARWAVGRGVTSFVATVCAGGGPQLVAFLRAGAEVVGPQADGATVAGMNLEGPFINPKRRGALPEGWPEEPAEGSFELLWDAALGHLTIMTMAPELAGSELVLRKAAARGVVVSIGHTDADYERCRRAFLSGASHVTHAFNAMRPFHHRDPGPIGAALDSEGATVEVIADGVHLHPATVRMLVKALGPERVVLVTDGVSVAGLGGGTARVGGQEAHLQEGRVALPDGTIAGSAASMDEGFRNVVHWGAAPLAEAARMASTVPARVVGLGSRKGRIAAGYDADLVALDENLDVVMTWIGGRLLHRQSEDRPG
jgi:N-acetylglucosamine-6-phosphate deacetylase